MTMIMLKHDDYNNGGHNWPEIYYAFRYTVNVNFEVDNDDNV